MRVRNILCIRADNMGDLLMSSPAIRALKETFNCKITLLTSAMGNLIVPFIKEIDDTIIANLPWVKTKEPVDEKEIFTLIELLRERHFDTAVIFTVYSQNPLPAAMMAYMAGIPERVAYCRENPYYLLTKWVVEKEPYHRIQHQVVRDIDLVKQMGAEVTDDHIRIQIHPDAKESAIQKLEERGININNGWLILHPGVSEAKRQYPEEKWIECGKLLTDNFCCPILITGSHEEDNLCKRIEQGIGSAFSLAGDLSMAEFIALVDNAKLIISVNTAPAHIAAATKTPVIVLYALTNPQHTPWKANASVLYFSVDKNVRSKNAVVNYVSENVMSQIVPLPSPARIVAEAQRLLSVSNVVV